MESKMKHMTQEQKRVLVELIHADKEQTIGKFTVTFTAKIAQKRWLDIASILNAIPGAHKEWKQWRKAWHDLTTATKSKQANIIKHQRKTGGGKISDSVVTFLDSKIIEVINPTAVNGLENIQESHCDFDSENLEVIVEDRISDFDECVNTETHSEQKINDIIGKIPISAKPPSHPSHTPVLKRSSELPVAAKRMKKSVIATNKLTELTEKKNYIKSNYYEQKLVLYEREVIAIEKIAETLVSYLDREKKLLSQII